MNREPILIAFFAAAVLATIAIAITAQYVDMDAETLLYVFGVLAASLGIGSGVARSKVTSPATLEEDIATAHEDGAVAVLGELDKEAEELGELWTAQLETDALEYPPGV